MPFQHAFCIHWCACPGFVPVPHIARCAVIASSKLSFCTFAHSPALTVARAAQVISIRDHSRSVHVHEAHDYQQQISNSRHSTFFSIIPTQTTMTTAFTTSLAAPLTTRGSRALCTARPSRTIARTPPAMRASGKGPDLPKIPQGFTSYSELLNGRAAMLGFSLAVVTELITGRGMLGQMHSVLEIVNMANALAN
eukprot:IDg8837t1